MIQDIFDTGKEIFELSSSLSTKKEAERLKLAHLLELIGHIVKEAVGNLKQGQPSASKNSQLEMLSEELYFRLAFSVGEIKARNLSSKLKSGYMAGQLQGERVTSPNLQFLAQLDAAAGFFLASSDNLRTTINTQV